MLTGRFYLICIWIFIIFTLGLTQEATEEQLKYGLQKEIIGNLSFTQNKFDNWTKGGEDSWSWQLDVNAKFVNDQEKYNWANTAKISYGKTKVADTEARKAADEIKFESVFTYKIAKYINPYFAVTGLSQITRGYNYTADEKIELSNFMDPGIFTQSIGLTYKPNENLKTRFGATVKETITKDHPQPYADNPKTEKIEKTKVEFGSESVTDLSVRVSENILFASKLELFSTFYRFNEIDINWDNIFSAKVSDYINVSFNLKLFYDKDISLKRQLKQTLAVGVTYSFL